MLEGKDPEFIRRSWNRLNNQFSAEIAHAKAELCEKEEEKRVKRTEERARTNVNTKKRKLVQSFWIDNNLYVSFKKQKRSNRKEVFKYRYYNKMEKDGYTKLKLDQFQTRLAEAKTAAAEQAAAEQANAATNKTDTGKKRKRTAKESKSGKKTLYTKINKSLTLDEDNSLIFIKMPLKILIQSIKVLGTPLKELKRNMLNFSTIEQLAKSGVVGKLWLPNERLNAD